MSKFIYVAGEDAKEVHLSKQYRLLKYDADNDIYVFENRADSCVDLDDIPYVLSDILTL